MCSSKDENTVTSKLYSIQSVFAIVILGAFIWIKYDLPIRIFLRLEPVASKRFRVLLGSLNCLRLARVNYFVLVLKHSTENPPYLLLTDFPLKALDHNPIQASGH